MNPPLGGYASPDYLLRAGTPDHPQALEAGQHCIIGYRGARIGAPLTYAMRRCDEQLRIQGRYVLSVDDSNAYLAAGVAGLGVLWLPRYMAEAPLARGELVPLFEDWKVDAMPLYLAYPPSRHVSRKLRVFIDWIVELLAQHAPSITAPR